MISQLLMLLVLGAFVLTGCERHSPRTKKDLPSGVTAEAAPPPNETQPLEGAIFVPDGCGLDSIRKRAVGDRLERDSASALSEEAAWPPHVGPLLPEQAHLLLSGTILFKPEPIPSSNRTIAPDTPLDVGQDLQIKWGESWWAGTILGFEPDGRIRVHYFGWEDSWNEPKPRAELQLDGSARVRALDSTFVRKNW